MGGTPVVWSRKDRDALPVVHNFVSLILDLSGEDRDHGPYECDRE